MGFLVLAGLVRRDVYAEAAARQVRGRRAAFASMLFGVWYALGALDKVPYAL